MKRKHREPADETPAPPSTPGRLDGMIGVHLDDDERPSREDRSYGQTIFTRPPVKIPRFLKSKRERH